MNRVFTRLTFLTVLAATTIPPCWGQFAATALQDSSFDGHTLTITYHEGGNGGREGTSRASVQLLNLHEAKVCAECSGGPYIELSCKDSSRCFVGSLRTTGLSLVAEGERTGSPPDAFPEAIVTCSSVSECENFLRALKESVTPKPAAISPRSVAGSQSDPSAEPVIDGRNIPSQIDFTRKSAPTPESQPLSGPLRPLLDSLNSQTGSAVTSMEKLSSLFDRGSQTSETGFEADPGKPLELGMSAIVEKYGPEMFDQLRKDGPKTPAAAVNYVTEKWLKELYGRFARDTSSYAFTGKSFNDQPEEFRKDYAVWDAGIKRILEPFSLRKGFELVDAFGQLFDLWDGHAEK